MRRALRKRCESCQLINSCIRESIRKPDEIIQPVGIRNPNNYSRVASGVDSLDSKSPQQMFQLIIDRRFPVAMVHDNAEVRALRFGGWISIGHHDLKCLHVVGHIHGNDVGQWHHIADVENLWFLELVPQEKNGCMKKTVDEAIDPIVVIQERKVHPALLSHL